MSGSIGYENLAESATITPSSEATDYDADNVADGLLHDAWKPSTGGDADIEFALTAADNAGYLGIAGHTLGTNGARAQLQYGDSTDWFPAGYTVDDPAGAQHVLAPSGSEVVYRNIGLLGENRVADALIQTPATYYTESNATGTANQAQAPDGTYTACELVEDGASGIHALSTNATNNPLSGYSGETVVASAYVKRGTGSRDCRLLIYEAATATVIVSVYVDLDDGSVLAGTGTVEDVGNGWYRVSVTGALNQDSVSGDLRIYCYNTQATSIVFTGDGSSSNYWWGVQLEPGTSPGALVPTASEPVTAGAADWRVQFYSKQNLQVYSEQFDNAAWSKVRSNITANATTAPDGTTTADKLYDDATASNTHYVTDTPTISAGWVTFSVYVKAGEYTSAHLQINSPRFGETQRAKFELSTQTVSIGNGSPLTSIESGEDGWYRVAISQRALSAGSNTFALFLDSGSGRSYTGDGASGVYIWGWQIEQAPSVGPYQVTTSAAVTDNDIGQVAVLAFGAPYDLPTGFRPGFNRPGVWDAAESDNSISQGGLFVGRSVTRVPQGFTISQDVADETALTNWAAFVERAKTAPFFFDWDNAGTNPVFAWSLDPGSDAPRYQTAQYLQFAMDCEGLSAT